MTLIKRCENCVFRYGKVKNNWITCNPKLPDWVYSQISETTSTVNNYEAEYCNAFRLRETGVNE